jgi:hypothetical protein
LLVASFAACGGAACGGARAIPREPADLGALPNGVARVCVIRPDRIAADVTMEIRDNGRLVGATRGTTFFCYLAAPGSHQITSVDDDTGPTYLEAHVGERYWLHQEIASLDGHVHAHLDWIDESTAIELLEGCESRVLVNVPGHDDREDALPLAPARRL